MADSKEYYLIWDLGVKGLKIKKSVSAFVIAKSNELNTFYVLVWVFLNTSLYLHNIMWTRDENKEKYQLWDY